MAEPQYFKAPDGTEMVIIERARYDALLAAEEDADDLAAAAEGRASLAAEGGIPLEVSLAIASGTHPIVAWRRHRRLSQAALAATAGLTQGGVARLEHTAPGAGRPETIAAIAKALEAPLWSLETAARIDEELAAEGNPLAQASSVSVAVQNYMVTDLSGNVDDLRMRAGIDHGDAGDEDALLGVILSGIEPAGVKARHEFFGGGKPKSTTMDKLARHGTTGAFAGGGEGKVLGRSKRKD